MALAPTQFRKTFLSHSLAPNRRPPDLVRASSAPEYRAPPLLQPWGEENREALLRRRQAFRARLRLREILSRGPELGRGCAGAGKSKSRLQRSPRRAPLVGAPPDCVMGGHGASRGSARIADLARVEGRAYGVVWL